MQAQKTRKNKLIGVLTTYCVSFCQGITLIIFPAAGNFFKAAISEGGFGFTDAQYGFIFVPMIFMAIAASLLSSRIATGIGNKLVLLFGTIANFVSMVLLAVSTALVSYGNASFIMVLLALGAIGAGFGFTLSALNAFAFDLFPHKSDAALTALHGLTGIGQASAPLIIGLFHAFGYWWGAAIFMAILWMIAIIWIAVSPLSLSTESEDNGQESGRKLPGIIYLFAALTLLYGIVESSFGNWGSILLHEDLGLELTDAGLALTVFWSTVTLARIAYSLTARWLPRVVAYSALPVMMVTAFLLIPSLQGTFGGILGMVLAGLACSYFFPLNISLVSSQAPALVTRISGIMVASIMIGTGIGSFGIGVLKDMLGTSLSTIFRYESMVALAMVILTIMLFAKNRRGIGK